MEQVRIQALDRLKGADVLTLHLGSRDHSVSGGANPGGRSDDVVPTAIELLRRQGSEGISGSPPSLDARIIWSLAVDGSSGRSSRVAQAGYARIEALLGSPLVQRGVRWHPPLNQPA